MLHHTLQQVPEGATAKIDSLQVNGAIRRRLLDLGMIPGTRIECLQKSPAGDPTAFLIRGAVIALRERDCKNVIIQ